MTLVDSVMSHAVETIAADARVREAALLMDAKRVGSLVVTRDGGAVGIVTERDLVSRVLALGLDADATEVAAIMSHPVLTIEAASHIDDAEAAMEEHGIHHMIVVRDGRVCGVLSSSDVARQLKDVERRLREAQRQGWQD